MCSKVVRSGIRWDTLSHYMAKTLIETDMEKIIEKYYVAEGSKLVMHVIGTNGVDCWFDTNSVRQHRCLSFEDFELIKGS
jgi:hypothetical protein